MTRRILPAPRARRSLALPLALLALLAAGVALALLLATNRHSAAKPPPPVAPVTVTKPGTTVRETVTAQQPSAPSAASVALQGYDKLKAHDFAGALPLLQQAAHSCRQRHARRGYNDYNLAYTLAQTQGCSGPAKDR
jgi:hypothetical protein